ncbi:MAG: AzlC family ABC transporter permease [Oscillospiraceae bacterium]|nr:AzlC family ABC transporter permease [Oscillospiraceae bacterium]
MDRKALAAAFPATMPVLAGYLSIGIAFGLMLQRIGFNFIWAFFMSVFIYAGSCQYMAVGLLASSATLTTVALMTFLINFRHLVYGLSMLEKFRGMGARKLYMIFSLTDETYALLSAVQAPVGVNAKNFYFAIALLDQCYWIVGAVIGAVAGALIPLDITGIDFAMTALFLVIAVDQWKACKKHIPAILGAAAAVLFLVLVGAEQFLLPSLAVIVLVLVLTRTFLDEHPEEQAGGQEEREA